MIVEGATVGAGDTTEGSNIESNIEVVKPPVFNRKVGKVGDFTAYRLYLRIRIREAMVEEQIQ